MKLKRGSTSVRRLIFVADSSSTTGAGLANLVYNTASLVAYYFAGDLANEVSITLATATLGTWASGGFVAVDNTNMPGWYEIGIPDAALDGGTEVSIQLRGATNMVPVNIYIELDAFDYQTATQPVNATQFAGQTITAAGGVTIPTQIASQASVDDIDNIIDTEFPAMSIMVTSILSDTNDIQTRLPAALDSGRIAAVLDSATALQITNIENAAGYTLAVLAGACADPQTASETYAITVFGSTFTVDFAGQTSTGTRTAPTLTKS